MCYLSFYLLTLPAMLCMLANGDPLHNAMADGNFPAPSEPFRWRCAVSKFLSAARVRIIRHHLEHHNTGALSRCQAPASCPLILPPSPEVIHRKAAAVERCKKSGASSTGWAEPTLQLSASWVAAACYGWSPRSRHDKPRNCLLCCAVQITKNREEVSKTEVDPFIRTG